jgi:tetratricopeptide (TPR) repeat protein
VYYKVACFLEDFAKYDGALNIFSEALLHYTNAAQNMAVAKTNYAIARIYSTLGRYQEAEQAMLQTLEVYARGPLAHLLFFCIASSSSYSSHTPVVMSLDTPLADTQTL